MTQGDEQMEKEKQEDEKRKKQGRSFKERLFIQPKPFLPFWDGLMMIVIVYSCFTSAYYAAIKFDICDNSIFWTENFCTIVFAMDIVFNFIRIPEDKVNQKVTHIELAKRYNANGRFILDLLATVPLYFVERVEFNDDYEAQLTS